jgi:hypothetical protein
VASAPAVGCGTTSPNRWSPKGWLRSNPWIGLVACTTVACWLASFGLVVWAGEPAFDTLHLRDRTKSTGVLLGRDSQHAYLAVRRQAVEASKGAIRGYLKKADDEERIAYEQLRDRTQAMVQEPQHDAYRFVLEQERDRALRWLSGMERTPSELVILSIPLGDVAKQELAGTENHAIALWAWYKQIDAPEPSDAASLREALQKENIDWKRESPDLGSRFQAIPQNGDEWNARMALVRYSRDREIEFQGTPGMMVRIGDRNAQADIASLLAQGVQQQSKDLLGELLDGRKTKRLDWLESCQGMLKEERDDYFRASCMEQDMAQSDGTVESVFVVRLGNEWKTIWKLSVPIDVHAVPNAAQQQVENDPQIRSLLTLVQSLGIGSQEAVDRALKTGAATMQAQSQVNQQFETFRQRFQHRLDIPVLRWDISAPSRRSQGSIERRR